MVWISLGMESLSEVIKIKEGSTMNKMSVLGGVLAASLAVPAFAVPVISVDTVSGVWSCQRRQ